MIIIPQPEVRGLGDDSPKNSPSFQWDRGEVVPVGCDPLDATLSAIFRHFCPHIRSLPFGSSLEIYKSPPGSWLRKMLAPNLIGSVVRASLKPQMVWNDTPSLDAPQWSMENSRNSWLILHVHPVVATKVAHWIPLTESSKIEIAGSQGLRWPKFYFHESNPNSSSAPTWASGGLRVAPWGSWHDNEIRSLSRMNMLDFKVYIHGFHVFGGANTYRMQVQGTNASFPSCANSIASCAPDPSHPSRKTSPGV